MIEEPKLPPIVICPTPEPNGTKYKLAEQLGKGGFAYVYRVIRQPDKTEFALKVCPREALENESFKAKYFAEIEIQSEMKHENIVQLKQNWRDDKYTYLIMELCKQGSVAQMLKRRYQIHEPEAALIMKQVVDAVVYMHQHNVIHRDLKLDNFLIDENGEIKITDFGISEIVSSQRKDLVFAGTPQYMGPEVIGLHEYGFQVDIWAIGVCTYELLTGHRPFEARDMKEMYKRINKGEFRFPPELHLSFIAKDFIESSLQVKPSLRPKITDLAKHPFLQQGKQFIESRNLDSGKMPSFGVSRYCDQTDKDGFAFLLYDGTCGVIFNDNTRLIIDPFGEFLQYWTSYEDAAPKVTNVSKADKTQKQIKKLFKFRENLMSDPKFYTLPAQHLNPNNVLQHVKYYVKNEKGKLFRLDNRIVQVNFETKEKVFVDYSKKIMLIFKDGSTKGEIVKLDENMNKNTPAYQYHKEIRVLLNKLCN